ncbi:MAG: hypothetical protein KJ025_16780 [Burkholderiales bacterium]|nr:hypothetical protein [Burkholderiales bacterium]
MRFERSSSLVVPGRRAVGVLTVVACAAALAGCSGWEYAMGASYGASTAAAAPAAGGAAATTTTVIAGGTGLYVSVSLGTTAANVLAAATGVAIYAAMLQESGEWRPWNGPPMLEGRTVNEQDCTKPIADVQANLKCK